MKKHRRVEITAFRRRVVVTSGGAGPARSPEQPPPVEEGVWLGDADTGEPIEVESAAGQLILADAVRSLEQRLSIKARGAGAGNDIATARSGRFGSRLYSNLRRLGQVITRPGFLRSNRKEKRNV